MPESKITLAPDGVSVSSYVWHRQHLYPRAGGSALRRSLGVHLGLVPTKLRRPERYYAAAVETEITRYLETCMIGFDVCHLRRLERVRQ